MLIGSLMLASFTGAPSGEAQRSFKADELPTHFLIDASGREVGRWPGVDDQLEDAVRALLLSPNGGS